MKIDYIAIENFRALKDVKFPVNQLSVIIGENDSGKTSCLYALNKFFEQKKITDTRDWHNYDTAVDINITLTFSGVSGVDEKFMQSDDKIKIEGVFKHDSSPVYHAIVGKDKHKMSKTDMEPFSTNYVVFLPVVRSVDNEFAMKKTAIFGRILRKQIQKESDKNSEMREAIEAIRKIMYRSIQGIEQDMRNFMCEQLNNDLIEVSLGDIDIDPVDGVQVSPTVSDEKFQNIPLGNRGAGTQNNAILALFRCIAKLEIKDEFILLLEEPENSLHPKAQRNLLNVIQGISKNAQILVATHSPVFIDRTRYESNILFSMKKEGTVANIFTEKGLPGIRNELGLRVSDVLLKGGADCALIVEGKTEEYAMPILMEMMDIKKSDFGITIVDMDGCGWKKASTIIDLLGSYSIPCVVMLDGDDEGKQCKEDLLRQKRDGEGLTYLEEVFCLEDGNTFEDIYPSDIIAKLLCDMIAESPCEEGEERKQVPDASELNIDESKSALNEIKRICHKYNLRTPDYFKTHLGSEGTKLMKKEQIPKEVKEIIEKVKAIASRTDSDEIGEESLSD